MIYDAENDAPKNRTSKSNKMTTFRQKKILNFVADQFYSALILHISNRDAANPMLMRIRQSDISAKGRVCNPYMNTAMKSAIIRKKAVQHPEV